MGHVRTLGLRVGVNDMHWAVVEGTVEQPICVDRGEVVAPKTYTEAGWLRHLRDRLQSIVNVQHPTSVALKGIEPVARARQTFFPRLRGEGVAIELCEALTLSPEILTWATLASRLGVGRSKKDYETSAEFRGIAWSSFGPESREAIMVAAAALGR